MTICIGAVCNGGHGIVLASDTMLTQDWLSIQFEHQSGKISHLSDTCAALTAGDALAYSELFNMVDGGIGRLRNPSVVEIVETIKKCYQEIRRKVITERFLEPRGFESLAAFYQDQRHLANEIAFTIQSQIDSYDYGLQILVGGISGDEAQLYGIFDPGTSRCFDAINFHAIGSGFPHAVNSLIARDYHSSFSVPKAIMAVYEAKRRAENAPGVGKMTDMVVMEPGTNIKFPRDVIAKFEAPFQLWKKEDPRWEITLTEILKKESEHGNETGYQHQPGGESHRSKEKIPDGGDGLSPKDGDRQDKEGATGKKAK